jgi:hypothetical protein
MPNTRVTACLVAALWVLSCPAVAQAPRISIPDHSYPPGSKTVLTLYTCKDGARSIALQTGQYAKSRIASMVRDGHVAPRNIIDRVNAAISRLDTVMAIHPECGSQVDVMIVEGRKNQERTQVLIGWSLKEVNWAGEPPRSPDKGTAVRSPTPGATETAVSGD